MQGFDPPPVYPDFANENEEEQEEVEYELTPFGEAAKALSQSELFCFGFVIILISLFTV